MNNHQKNYGLNRISASQLGTVDKWVEGCDTLLYVRLNRVQPGHVHLKKPILPVNPGNPVVVNTTGDEAEWLAILTKAVFLVIYVKRAGRRKLNEYRSEKEIETGDGRQHTHCKLC